MVLTHSLGDDASQKDLIFAILMSTGDGSGNIKANWPEVERIMTSWGYGFTAGAMCKFWHLHMPTGAFVFQSSVAYASIEAFTYHRCRPVVRTILTPYHDFDLGLCSSSTLAWLSHMSSGQR